MTIAFLKGDADVGESSSAETKKARGFFGGGGGGGGGSKKATTTEMEEEIKNLCGQLRDALTKVEEMKQQRECARRQALEMSNVLRALQSITVEYDRVELDEDPDITPQQAAMKNITAKVLAIRAHQQRMIHENKKLQEEKEILQRTAETQATVIGSLHKQVDALRLASSVPVPQNNTEPDGVTPDPSATVSPDSSTNPFADRPSSDPSKSLLVSTDEAGSLSLTTSSVLEAKLQMLGTSQDLHERQMQLVKANKDLKDEILLKDNRIAFLESQMSHQPGRIASPVNARTATDASESANDTPLHAIDESSEPDLYNNDDNSDALDNDTPPPPSEQQAGSVHVASSANGSVEVALMQNNGIDSSIHSHFTDDSTIFTRRERVDSNIHRTRYHFEFGGADASKPESKKKKGGLFGFGSKSSSLKKQCEHFKLERDILLEDVEKMDVDIRDLESERDSLRRDCKFLTKELDRTRDMYEKLLACHSDEKAKTNKLEQELGATSKALDDAVEEYEELRYDHDALIKELTELRGRHEDLEAATQAEKQMTEEKLAKIEGELNKMSEKASVAKAKQEQRSVNLRDVIFHYKQLQRQHKHMLKKMEELEAEHCIALEKLDKAEAAVQAAQIQNEGANVQVDTKTGKPHPKNQFLQELQDKLKATTDENKRLDLSLKAREEEVKMLARAKVESERSLKKELDDVGHQRMLKEKDLNIVFKHMELMSKDFEATKSKLRWLEARQQTAASGASEQAVEAVDLTGCTSDDESVASTDKPKGESRVIDALRAAVDANQRYESLNAEYEKALASLRVAERKLAAAEKETESRIGTMRDAVHRYKSLETEHNKTLSQIASLEEQTALAKREARLADCKVKNTRQRLTSLNSNFQTLTKKHNAALERVKQLEEELDMATELVLEYENNAVRAESGDSHEGLTTKRVGSDNLRKLVVQGKQC